MLPRGCSLVCIFMCSPLSFCLWRHCNNLQWQCKSHYFQLIEMVENQMCQEHNDEWAWPSSSSFSPPPLGQGGYPGRSWQSWLTYPSFVCPHLWFCSASRWLYIHSRNKIRSYRPALRNSAQLKQKRTHCNVEFFIPVVRSTVNISCQVLNRLKKCLSCFVNCLYPGPFSDQRHTFHQQPFAVFAGALLLIGAHCRSDPITLQLCPHRPPPGATGQWWPTGKYTAS